MVTFFHEEEGLSRVFGRRVAGQALDLGGGEVTVRGTVLTCALAGLMMMTLPCALRADDGGVFGGGGLKLGLPTGDLADSIDAGYGFDLHSGWMAPGGALALRVDGGFLIYGSETVRVPLSETVSRVTVDVTTTNWIGSLMAGPQLGLPRGPIRPYVRAQAGFSYFATTSDVSGSSDIDSFASSTNYDDLVFGYVLGGGVAIPLSLQHSGALCLDLGVSYVRNGRVSYLAEGDIHEGAGGELILTPRRTRADLIEVRLGLTFWR
jgi:hypothetical protein